MLNLQDAFNIAVALAGAGGGWILKVIWDAVKELQLDAKKLPETYARRDDMKDQYQNLTNVLERIEYKIDNKADKQ